MPILAREADQFPIDLLSTPTLDQSGMHWFAAHTLPRREKDLMRRLLAEEIAYYGPLMPRRFRSPNGRRRTSYVPLFPGYVFVRADAGQKERIFNTGSICQLLEVQDESQLVADLCQIQRLIHSEAPLTPEARILPGDQVRVKSGSFVGFEGVVVSRRGQHHLLVTVSFLQQGASVLIDDCELESLG